MVLSLRMAAPAAHGQQQDRQEDIDQAGWRAQRGRGQLRRSTYADRAATGGRVGEGAQRSARPNRPAGPLLRPRWHLIVRSEASGQPGPCFLPQGPHRQSGPRRFGRAGRRQVRAARRAAAVNLGVGWSPCRSTRVLPLRRRQRGELPADGSGAARQRTSGLRGRTAQSRRCPSQRVIRADERCGGIRLSAEITALA